jgi:flagella basal body P-ring formation protein FlgA
MMLLALLAAACLPVNGPHITAKDIAAAVPAYTPQDPEAVFGYAPLPGVQRVVHPVELHQFLAREHFDGTPPVTDVCFARPTAVLTDEAVIRAMRTALGTNAQIQLEEISRFPTPLGELIFPREEAGPFWHGYVRYDVDKKFPVWARATISIKAVRVIALEDLHPGAPIQATQLTLETVDETPGRRTTPASIDKVAGCMPRRIISANSPVWTDAIDPPNEITKGDRVNVIVHSGLAQLSFDAEAQTSGRRGDMVSFKNPESGKLFRARVEGPGRAAMQTNP